jgi:Cu-processing system permease protein
VLVAVLVGWRVPSVRSWLPLAWAVVILGAGLLLAGVAPDDRRVLAGSAMLIVCEVSIITCVTTLFSSFSSPFLTAVFTVGLLIVGRSADTLAALPARVFGEGIHRGGVVLSKLVPNLMIYQPPRSLLTGESAAGELLPYVGSAALHALAWSVFLLAVATIIFRKRDFL